jgi:transposase
VAGARVRPTRRCEPPVGEAIREREVVGIDLHLHRAVIARIDEFGNRRLLTIGGVGPTLAAIFVAEIGDVTRCKHAGALCCWSGAAPRHCESDKTVRRGHVSKEGNTLAR